MFDFTMISVCVRVYVCLCVCVCGIALFNQSTDFAYSIGGRPSIAIFNFLHSADKWQTREFVKLKRRKLHLINFIKLRTIRLTHLRKLWNFVKVYSCGVIPLSARSEMWVCGRSLAGIEGSNPAGDKDVCFECCVLSGRDLCAGLIRRPEESFRVLRVWLWSWSLDNEEALVQ